MSKLETDTPASHMVSASYMHLCACYIPAPAAASLSFIPASSALTEFEEL